MRMTNEILQKFILPRSANFLGPRRAEFEEIARDLKMNALHIEDTALCAAWAVLYIAGFNKLRGRKLEPHDFFEGIGTCLTTHKSISNSIYYRDFYKICMSAYKGAEGKSFRDALRKYRECALDHLSGRFMDAYQP